ncbi:MAG TPA: FHA domain-containing protein, partial [Polyangiaceae bacterium]
MDFEIGVVCARCDRYAVLGATSCSECGNALALFPPRAPATSARAKLPSMPSLAAPDDTHPPPSVRRPTPYPARSRSSPPPAPVPSVEATGASSSRSLVAKAAYTDPPPSSILQNQPLVPRRPGGAGPHVSGTPSGLRPALASGLETAVSSPLADALSPAPSRDLAALAAASNLTLEELMDQAKNFVCRSCSTPVPVGHKFCGRCGAAVPPEILGARTQFFGQLQAPGKAKLILIRGEGVEGLSYQLNAEQHVVGRNGQLVFPDDPFVSPKHANLFYRGGKLVVRDEGSINGVFVRVKGTIEAQPGDQFLAGEQLFKLDANPKANDGPAPDGTYFYSSPKHQSLFRITQVLQGGAPGMVVCARGQTLQIGREGGDLNFPGDLYMSASHCRIEELTGKFALTDLN